MPSTRRGLAVVLSLVLLTGTLVAGVPVADARAPPTPLCGVCSDRLDESAERHDVALSRGETDLVVQVHENGSTTWRATVELTAGADALDNETLREENEALRARLWPLIEAGRIAPVMDQVFPLAEAAAAHGAPTVLVSNAANDVRHTIAETTRADWDANLAVNLTPYFVAARAVAPGMRAAGGGAIVSMSSISYMMGNAGYVAGITGLTRGLARELGPDGIRANALMPGWVLTEKQLARWATPEDLAAHLDRQCLKEHLKPADLVGACLFLASKASRMMTGQALVVDGGVVVTG